MRVYANETFSLNLYLPFLYFKFIHHLVAYREGNDDILYSSIVKGLLKYQEIVDNDKTALYESIEEGELELAMLLIEQDYEGKDVNGTSTESEETALMEASYRGYFDVAKLLVENGADVNLSATDDGGSTNPLYYACQEGHTDLVRLLIDNKANVNKACTDNGRTPLYCASFEGYTDIARLLIDGMADVIL